MDCGVARGTYVSNHLQGGQSIRPRHRDRDGLVSTVGAFHTNHALKNATIVLQNPSIRSRFDACQPQMIVLDIPSVWLAGWAGPGYMRCFALLRTPDETTGISLCFENGELSPIMICRAASLIISEQIGQQSGSLCSIKYEGEKEKRERDKVSWP